MEEKPTLDNQESSNPEESEETLNPEELAEPEDVIEEEAKTDKFEELYKNQKIRAEKAETERKALEEKLNAAIKSDGKAKEGLDIEDYIDISASLEGLDKREKEYLAREHKLTNTPLPEIRESEDYKLWQSAYQAKVEKEEKTLKPNGTQSDSERPQSLTDQLTGASLADKEKMLKDAGYYKSPRPRTDRINIGDQGLR